MAFILSLLRTENLINVKTEECLTEETIILEISQKNNKQQQQLITI